MRQAVFLDRDGTIIKEIGNLTLKDINKVRFFKGAAEAIKKLNHAGFIVVVVTNQPVVARGLATEKEVDQIHAILIKRLARRKAIIDAIYFCPHHPEATLLKYRVKCRCRKPNVKMLIQAAKKFNLDLKKSFLIGDRLADVRAAKKIGLKMILVKTGYGLDTLNQLKNGKTTFKPDFVAKNLKEAVEIILNFNL